MKFVFKVYNFQVLSVHPTLGDFHPPLGDFQKPTVESPLTGAQKPHKSNQTSLL
jgi:hypothetical protein